MKGQTLTLAGISASEDLTGGQYKFVLSDGDHTVAASGAGEGAVGVLTNKPDTGEAASVVCAGHVEVEAGAAVSAGAKVMANASGQAITATATNEVLGIAMQAATEAGERISLYFNPVGILAV